jgi:hypothetical protein
MGANECQRPHLKCEELVAGKYCKHEYKCNHQIRTEDKSDECKQENQE